MRPPLSRVAHAHVKAMRTTTERWLDVMTSRANEALIAYEKRLITDEEWARLLDIFKLMQAMQEEVKDWR